MQNEQAHCVMRVRFSALNSPRHSLQVNLIVGVKAFVVVVVVVAEWLLIGDTGSSCVGLGENITVLDETDAPAGLPVAELGLGEEAPDEDEDAVDDELGDEAPEDELEEEQLVVVSRSRLPTYFRFEPPSREPFFGFFGTSVGSCASVADTGTNAPLDALSE